MRPPAGQRLCRLDEIGDPGALGFVFGHGEDRFAGFVLRRGQAVRGFVDACPHIGAPLALTATGYLTRQGDYVVCSTHGALFQPDDGLGVAGPCAGRRLQPWAVEATDGEVRAA